MWRRIGREQVGLLAQQGGCSRADAEARGPREVCRDVDIAAQAGQIEVEPGRVPLVRAGRTGAECRS